MSGIVVVSGLDVASERAGELEAAFRSRLGAVDAWPGFQGLEVLRDLARPGRYVMSSRWADRTSFARYMRSPEHQASHDRVPGGDAAPRLVFVSRYEVVCR